MLLGMADRWEVAWRQRVRECGKWLHWLLSRASHGCSWGIERVRGKRGEREMIGGCNGPMTWWKAAWSTGRSATDLKPEGRSGCPDEQATGSWETEATEDAAASLPWMRCRQRLARAFRPSAVGWNRLMAVSLRSATGGRGSPKPGGSLRRKGRVSRQTQGSRDECRPSVCPLRRRKRRTNASGHVPGARRAIRDGAMSRLGASAQPVGCAQRCRRETVHSP